MYYIDDVRSLRRRTGAGVYTAFARVASRTQDSGYLESSQHARFFHVTWRVRVETRNGGNWLCVYCYTDGTTLSTLFSSAAALTTSYDDGTLVTMVTTNSRTFWRRRHDGQPPRQKYLSSKTTFRPNITITITDFLLLWQTCNFVWVPYFSELLFFSLRFP